MEWRVDTTLFNEATGQPYNPPALTSPAQERTFDHEFGDMTANLRAVLAVQGYQELYDEARGGKAAHYHLVKEHSGDRAIAMELLHSVMGSQCEMWLSSVQRFLARQAERYQVIATSAFEDHEGIQLLPGFAGLAVRSDVVIAHFSTIEMRALFLGHKL